MEYEIYDYVADATPQYTGAALSVTPWRVLPERGIKNQVVHTADDNSEERISLSDASIWRVELEWDYLSAEDASAILDYYMDPGKANGIARSFKWDHPTDGHTYVVRFDGDLAREWYPRGSVAHAVRSVRLKVIGRINDGS